MKTEEQLRHEFKDAIRNATANFDLSGIDLCEILEDTLNEGIFREEYEVTLSFAKPCQRR